MRVSLLLRTTLLLHLANHCFTQEWHTQADLRTDFLSTGVPKGPKPSFPEKRDIGVNDANVGQSTEYYYVANTREKRDKGDASEEGSNATDDSSSRVPERSFNSSDWYTLLETNATNVENNSYEAGDWKHGNDMDTETLIGGYKGNKTTMLDDVEKNNDILDERKEQSSSNHDSHANEVMNALQENKKNENENGKDAKKIDETNEQADGSENLLDERFPTDREEDEQPVKRQNLAWGVPQPYGYPNQQCCPPSMICPVKPPCVPNTGGYNGFQGYGNYPGYSSYKPPVSLSFQSPIAPTTPQYASKNASPTKNRMDTAPIKSRPTAEKAATRKISFEDGLKTKQNQKDASPQTKQIISSVDDQAEYDGIEQSYAGHNVRENEKQFYGSFSKDSDGKGVLPEKSDFGAFTAQNIRKENNAVHQPKKNVDEKFPEKDFPKKAGEENSQQNKDDSSKKHDYKDEIEKEAVEQEKEADEMAEKKGSGKQDNRHAENIDEDIDDDNMDDDDDDNEDDDDDSRDEDENNNDDDDDNEKEHSNQDSMKHENKIYNPADQPFAVSNPMLPGMCPPCPKPTKAQACSAKIDLAFLVDGSSSVERYGVGNFRRIINFVRGLTMGFAISRTNTRVSLVVYGTRAKILFDFRR